MIGITLAIRLVLDQAANTEEAVALLWQYDMMEAVFDDTDSYSSDTAWDALKAASQEPSAEDITSNMQWSVSYNDTKLTAGIVLRRKWADVIEYSLRENRIFWK